MNFSNLFDDKIEKNVPAASSEQAVEVIDPPASNGIKSIMEAGLSATITSTEPLASAPWEIKEINGNPKKNIFVNLAKNLRRYLTEKPEKPIKDTSSHISAIIKKISSHAQYGVDFSAHILTLRDLRYESVLGIDITPHCIYLCKIDGLNGKRVLSNLTSVCMEGKFLRKDILENPDDYSNGIKSMIKDNDIKSKNVAISIPVSESMVKTVTIPNMNDKQIKNALQFGSLWNNFMSKDEDPNNYSIFYQIIRRKKNEDTMDVLFAATKLSSIQLYTDIVKNSGLNPVIVDIRCFAISNAFSQKANVQGNNSLFLELNAEENYALIPNGKAASVFNISIDNVEKAAITNHIMDKVNIDAFVQSYARQIKTIVDSHESKNADIVVKNIYILSSLPLAHVIINKLQKTLEYYTVAHCNFFDCMQIEDDFTINAKSALHNLSAWSVAIGNALHMVDVFGKSSLKYAANLLPSARKYKSAKRLQYILNSAIIMASVVLCWFASATQNSLYLKNNELSAELASLSGVEDLYNKDSSAFSHLALQNNNVLAVDELMNDLTANQTKLLSIQQYLNVAVVNDVWLKEFNFIAPDKITIMGGATADQGILEFIDMLNQGKQFDKISLRGMQEVRELSFSEPEAVAVKNFQLDAVVSSAQMSVVAK
jgi:type IV pilus assembly protein PilN